MNPIPPNHKPHAIWLLRWPLSLPRCWNIFSGVMTQPSQKSLAGELADVALYLLQLASVTGIDLEEAILQKLAVNQHREWPDP